MCEASNNWVIGVRPGDPFVEIDSCGKAIEMTDEQALEWLCNYAWRQDPLGVAIACCDSNAPHISRLTGIPQISLNRIHFEKMDSMNALRERIIVVGCEKGILVSV